MVVRDHYNPKYQERENKIHHERTLSQYSYDPVKLNGKIKSGEKSVSIKEVNSIAKNSHKESERVHTIEDFKVEGKNHKKTKYGSDKKDSSFSKVDEKINSIHNKIKEFEEKKKKLNIEYTPFKKERGHNHSVSDFDHKKVQQYKETP